MKVVIYGAGAVGSVVGGHLGHAGCEVVLVGRRGHVQAMNKQGLRLITPSSTHLVRLVGVVGIDQIDVGPDDVIFLCVKGQNTEEAVRDLRALGKEVPIFCFQNGVRNEEIAAMYSSRVYGVMIKGWMAYHTDGEVIACEDPPAKFIVGRYPHGIDRIAEEVAKKLRTAGFLVMLTPDIMPYKWGKLMANLINAIEAITDERGEEVESIACVARQELRDLLTQAHVPCKSLHELAEEWPETNLPLLGRLESQAKTSTWQSLSRRQGSVETEFLNGEVVRLAEKLGLKAPINKKLVQICQQMATNRETPGKYTAIQLRALLGLQ